MTDKPNSRVEELSSLAHALVLGLSPDSPREAVIEAYDAAKALVAAAEELRRTCNEIVRQWCEENGDLVWAPNPDDLTTARRLRDAPDNKVKCIKDPPEMLELVLESVEGDIDAALGVIGRCLSTSDTTWKQSEFGEQLGDEAWSKAFRRMENRRLAKGKPTQAQRKILEEKYMHTSQRAREEIKAEIERQKAEQ